MDELSDEEVVAAISSSLKEVHMVDNGDGTVTMTCVMKIGDESVESVGVFQANLGEWFGIAIAAGAASLSKPLEDILETGVMVPNSPEESS